MPILQGGAQMSDYTALWLIWLALFVAVEGTALAKKAPGATLSAHVWKWFSIKEKGKGWRARRFALLAFLAWLVAHFLTGGKF